MVTSLHPAPEDFMETDSSFAAMLKQRRIAARTITTGGKRRVKQAGKEASDINVMIRKWIKNGTPPVASGREPHYGDFGQGIEYHEALTRLVEIQDQFLQVPAPVRSYCNNDPGLFLDLCSDPEQLPKLRELGLVQDRIPPIQRVEVVNPTPPPAPSPEE